MSIDSKKKTYIIDNHVLMSEWNWEKNIEFDPSQLTVGSGIKVWWKCSNGHEWQATIRHRNDGTGCPYCAGKKVLKGYNDLQTVNPAVAKEWHDEKNNGLTPMDVMPNSDKKAWWKCNQGHEWQATINSRNNGRGCPYCSGRYAIKGENDLQIVNPFLANEWNYEKNSPLKPEDFKGNSNKKVWWKCAKGHEWQATINRRSNGSGCPICNSERHTSFPEYAMGYYLKKHNLEVIHTYKEKGYELDIFIPSRKIAIEYDGYHWHKNKTKQDLNKNLKCKKDGIKLYRIREGLPPLNDSSLDYVVQRTQKDLSIVLEKVLSEIIGISVDVNLERDSVAIDDLREFTEKENSLLFANPEIANEWNYEKNGSLRPEYIASNSNKKVWWKCNKGHEWQTSINQRNNGTGCPYCSGRYVIKGYNDLQTVNPILAKEWYYEKNNELTPMDVMPNSNKKVWWKCGNGHEWQATPNHRSSGTGCPYCSSKKVSSGFNDLLTVNPTLVEEWDYEKNGALKPEHFTANSEQKIWWKCSKGHEWQATIANRNNGRGCPYCVGKKIIYGHNDLQTTNPILANEWNYNKNNGLTPRDVTSNSNKKVWWKCSNDHEWQATINHRNAGIGCPYCSGQKVLKGYNDLQTLNPALAQEWNYVKNDSLIPENFTAHSGQKVWWRCSKGHEWQATISHRNSGTGCPICYKQRKTKK